MENLGIGLVIFGILLIFSIMTIWSFMVHWILGIIVMAILLITTGIILIDCD